jgi:hypothetical protein
VIAVRAHGKNRKWGRFYRAENEKPQGLSVWDSQQKFQRRVIVDQRLRPDLVPPTDTQDIATLNTRTVDEIASCPLWSMTRQPGS